MTASAWDVLFRATESKAFGRKPKFREDDHPRDRQGRFIETGATVRLLGGALATVVAKADGDRITVRRDDNQKLYNIDKGALTVVKRPNGGEPTDNQAEALAIETDPGVVALNRTTAEDSDGNEPAAGAPATAPAAAGPLTPEVLAAGVLPADRPDVIAAAAAYGRAQDSSSQSTAVATINRLNLAETGMLADVAFVRGHTNATRRFGADPAVPAQAAVDYITRSEAQDPSLPSNSVGSLVRIDGARGRSDVFTVERVELDSTNRSPAQQQYGWVKLTGTDKNGKPYTTTVRADEKLQVVDPDRPDDFDIRAAATRLGPEETSRILEGNNPDTATTAQLQALLAADRDEAPQAPVTPDAAATPDADGVVRLTPDNPTFTIRTGGGAQPPAQAPAPADAPPAAGPAPSTPEELVGTLFADDATLAPIVTDMLSPEQNTSGSAVSRLLRTDADRTGQMADVALVTSTAAGLRAGDADAAATVRDYLQRRQAGDRTLPAEAVGQVVTTTGASGAGTNQPPRDTPVTFLVDRVALSGFDGSQGEVYLSGVDDQGDRQTAQVKATDVLDVTDPPEPTTSTVGDYTATLSPPRAGYASGNRRTWKVDVEVTDATGESVYRVTREGPDADSATERAQADADRATTYLTTEQPDSTSFATPDAVRDYYAAGLPNSLRTGLGSEELREAYTIDSSIALVPGTDGNLLVRKNGTTWDLIHTRSGFSLSIASADSSGKKNALAIGEALVRSSPDVDFGRDASVIADSLRGDRVMEAVAEVDRANGRWKSLAVTMVNAERIRRGEDPLLPESGIPRKVGSGRTAREGVPRTADMLQAGDIIETYGPDGTAVNQVAIDVKHPTGRNAELYRSRIVLRDGEVLSLTADTPVRVTGVPDGVTPGVTGVDGLPVTPEPTAPSTRPVDPDVTGPNSRAIGVNSVLGETTTALLSNLNVGDIVVRTPEAGRAPDLMRVQGTFRRERVARDAAPRGTVTLQQVLPDGQLGPEVPETGNPTATYIRLVDPERAQELADGPYRPAGTSSAELVAAPEVLVAPDVPAAVDLPTPEVPEVPVASDAPETSTDAPETPQASEPTRESLGLDERWTEGPNGFAARVDALQPGDVIYTVSGVEGGIRIITSGAPNWDRVRPVQKRVQEVVPIPESPGHTRVYFADGTSTPETGNLSPFSAQTAVTPTSEPVQVLSERVVELPELDPSMPGNVTRRLIMLSDEARADGRTAQADAIDAAFASDETYAGSEGRYASYLADDGAIVLLDGQTGGIVPFEAREGEDAYDVLLRAEASLPGVGESGTALNPPAPDGWTGDSSYATRTTDGFQQLVQQNLDVPGTWEWRTSSGAYERSGVTTDSDTAFAAADRAVDTIRTTRAAAEAGRAERRNTPLPESFGGPEEVGVFVADRAGIDPDQRPVVARVLASRAEQPVVADLRRLAYEAIGDDLGGDRMRSLIGVALAARSVDGYDTDRAHAGLARVLAEDPSLPGLALGKQVTVTERIVLPAIDGVTPRPVYREVAGEVTDVNVGYDGYTTLTVVAPDMDTPTNVRVPSDARVRLQDTADVPDDLPADPPPLPREVPTLGTTPMVDLQAGDRIVLDGVQARVVNVDVDADGDGVLKLLLPDGSEFDYPIDPGERAMRISGGEDAPVAALPTEAPARKARPPVTPGAQLFTAGRLNPGDRFRVFDGIYTVVKRQDNDEDTVLLTVERNGVRETEVYGRLAVLDRVHETDLPTPSAPPRGTGGRPALYTYQRRNLVALGLDERDGDLGTAAARVRLRQPLSEAEANALSAELRRIAANPDVRPVRQRSMERLALAIDAAAAEAAGRAAPAPSLPNGRPERSSLRDVGEGDHVVVTGPDGVTISGTLSGVAPIMSGRLYRATVTGDDGVDRDVVLNRDQPLYRLPDLPPPGPVAPAPPQRRDPVREHVPVSLLRAGDRIDIPAGRGTTVFGPATVTGTVDDDGRVVVRLDSSGAERELQTTGDGPTAIRTGRGQASAGQPWTHTMADEDPTDIGVADIALGDRIRMTQVDGVVVTGQVVEVNPVTTTDRSGTEYASLRIRQDDGATTRAIASEQVTRLRPAAAGEGEAIAAAEADRLRRGRIREASAAVDQFVEGRGQSIVNKLRALNKYGSDREALLAELDKPESAPIPGLPASDRQIAARQAIAAAVADVLPASGKSSETERDIVGNLIDTLLTDRREALRRSIANADDLPGDAPGTAIARVLAQWQDTPPVVRNTGAVLDTLSRGTNALPGEERLDGPTVVPEVTGSLADRMDLYRSALPDDFADLGRAQVRRYTYTDLDLDKLEAGELPEVATVTTGGDDIAADGGPGLTAMAHLDVVLAAGADMRKDYERRFTTAQAQLGPRPGEDGGPSVVPREQFVAALRRRDAAQLVLRDRIAAEYGFRDYQHVYDNLHNSPDSPDQERRAAIAHGAMDRAQKEDEAYLAEAAELDGLVKQRNTVMEQRAAYDKALVEARRRAALDSLRAVRKMGPAGEGTLGYIDVNGDRLEEDNELVVAMRYAEQHYPPEWLDGALLSNRAQDYTLEDGPRGGHSVDLKRIVLSSHVDKGEGPPRGAVAIHELGHGMEVSVPGLLAAERALLWSRTSTGEVGSRERERVKGISSTDDREVAYHDEFREPYTGRHYSGRAYGEAYELFTTSVEDLFGGEDKYLDEQMTEWTLGVLALLGRQKINAEELARRAEDSAARRQRNADRRRERSLERQVDDGGYPMRLSYEYLSSLDEDALDDLGVHLSGRLDDGDPVEGQRYDDWETYVSVQQRGQELAEELDGEVSDDEVQARVDEWVAANGRPGLTHPRVGGTGPRTRTGPTRAEVQDEFAVFVENQYIAAEEFTRGHMLNKAGEARGVSPRALFSGDVRQVYRYASEELLEFWETTRRMSWSEYWYARSNSPAAAAAAARSAAANARIDRDRQGNR